MVLKELEETDYKAGEPMRITLKKGEEDEALLIKNRFKDFSFGGYDVKYSGMSGIGDGASDSIIYEQNGFGYSPVGNFLFPELRCARKVAKKPSILRIHARPRKFIHVPMICLDVIGRMIRRNLQLGTGCSRHGKTETTKAKEDCRGSQFPWKWFYLEKKETSELHLMILT